MNVCMLTNEHIQQTQSNYKTLQAPNPCSYTKTIKYPIQASHITLGISTAETSSNSSSPRVILTPFQYSITNQVHINRTPKYTQFHKGRKYKIIDHSIPYSCSFNFTISFTKELNQQVQSKSQSITISSFYSPIFQFH